MLHLTALDQVVGQVLAPPIPTPSGYLFPVIVVQGYLNGVLHYGSQVLRITNVQSVKGLDEYSGTTATPVWYGVEAETLPRTESVQRPRTRPARSQRRCSWNRPT